MWRVLNVATENHFDGRCFFLLKVSPEIRDLIGADMVKSDLWARQQYQL